MAYKKPKTKAELRKAINQLSRIRDNSELWSSFGVNVRRALTRQLNQFKKQLGE